MKLITRREKIDTYIFSILLRLRTIYKTKVLASSSSDDGVAPSVEALVNEGRPMKE
jgi:hypothetical protein